MTSVPEDIVTHGMPEEISFSKAPTMTVTPGMDGDTVERVDDSDLTDCTTANTSLLSNQ